MIERTEERFEIKPRAAHSGHRQIKDGTFSREDFRFDQERNIYICPAGKVLATTGHVGPDHALRYPRCRPNNATLVCEVGRA
jgi:hypothetical protein